MSDVSVRLTLQDDVSSKLDKVSSSAKKTSSQLQQMGKQLDNAFKSASPEQFASELGNAMNDAVDDVESLGESIDQAMRDMGKGMGVDFSGGFDTAAESAGSLAEAAEEAGKAIEEISGAGSDIGKELGEGLEETGEKMKRLRDEHGRFIKQSKDTGGVGEGLEALSEEAEAAGESMAKAEGKAISLGSALRTLFAAVAGAKALGEVKDFAMDSVELGKGFTSMMSEVQAISGASSGEIAKLEQTARDYGATTVFSASEAAEALKYMSLAGWDADQSSSALGGVLNLAAASGMGLGQASDMVTDYLSAFGMDASQSTYFADMLSYAQSNSNTTAEQLGEAYRNAAANMHAAGQDVETTTSLLEAMANQGYKGSEAGTALAATMRDITQKMDDGAIKIGDTSVAVQDSQGNFRDLTEILKDVESATDGMGDAEKAAALGSTFTADSIKALNMVLTEGMDKISGYEDALRLSGGTSEKMAAIMNDNLTGDMANMNSAFEEMQLQVFESMEEPLRDGVQYLTSDVIPILTEWVPDAFGTAASGAAKLGNALKPMLETVLKNPQAVAKAFTSIGAGLAVFKGANFAKDMLSTADGASKLTSALGKLGSFAAGNKLALAASGIVAGVIAVKAAVDEYNEIQMEENLASHFGDISLTSDQAQELAQQVIPVGVTAQLELVNVAFDEAESLVTEAEELLDQNDYINWKVNTIGLDLTESDASSLLQNTEQFVSNVEDALEKEEYSAELAVKTLLGDVDSTELVGKMQSWFQEDLQTVESLGNAVTDLLQKSIDEGAYNINTQTAIEIMQAKMLDIVNGQKQAELQAQKDWLDITASGAALSSESWAETVGYMDEYRQNLQKADEETYQGLLGYFEQAKYNGHIDQTEMDGIIGVIGKAVSQQNSTALASEWEWLSSSMNDAYGEELSALQNAMGSASFKDKITGFDWQSGLSFAQNDLEYAVKEQFKGLDSGTQDALADRYETMLPTIQQMDEIISEAARQGEAVPEALMTSYREAMAMGAASGDTEAMWQYMANEVAQDFPGMDEFVSTLESNGLNFSDFPEEVQECFEKAFVDTDSSLDFSGMLSDLVSSASENGEINLSAVERILNEYGLSISEYIQETGIEADADGAVKINTGEFDAAEIGKSIEGLTATGNHITLPGGEIALEYEVNTGDTLSGIAEKTGVAIEELKSANQALYDKNGSWDLIYEGDLVYIPQVEADTSFVSEEAGKAAEEVHQEAQAAADAANKDVTTDGTVDGNYTAGEAAGADTAGQELGQKAKEQAEGAETPPAEQQIPTTITFEVASLDDSELASAITDKLGEKEPVPVDVPANVTVELGEANTTVAISAAVTQTQNDLDSAFAATFPANGNVDVVLTETNNVPEIYSEVGNAVQSAFAAGYHASAAVSVVLTANYSLANPSATISFGGGATGSASVTASLHADGGYFDQPHLGIVAEAGVGEYIIPMDGSDRSKDMWADAGRMLGIDMKPSESVQPVATTMAAGSPVTGNGSGSRDINLNINGSGSLKVSGGGVSKEQIVNFMLENLRDALLGIIEQEILEEADGVYEY